MSSTFAKKISILAFSLLLVYAVALPLYAAKADGDQICTPTDSAGTNIGSSDNVAQDDLPNCINRVYYFAIALGSVMAVIFIVIAGYLYIFSGGNEKNVGKAKELISSALIGLAILIAGLLLLKQINPELLSIKNLSPGSVTLSGCDPIKNPNACKPQQGNNINPGGGTPPPGGGTVGNGNNGGGSLPPGGKCLATARTVRGVAYPKCPPGSSIGLVDGKSAGIAFKNNSYLAPSALEALKKLKAYTDANGGPSWRVTEGYPPSSPHSSNCHYNGRCVDINPLSQSPENYYKLCSALTAVGLPIFNEVKGLSGSCGTSHNTTFGTGNHLHINLP